MPPISPMRFAELCIRLKRKPIRFDDRPYLAEIYDNPMRRLVNPGTRDNQPRQGRPNTSRPPRFAFLGREDSQRSSQGLHRAAGSAG